MAKKKRWNWGRAWIPYLIIMLLILFAYSGSLTAPFHFDDLPDILYNRPLQIDHLSFKSLIRAAKAHPIPEDDLRPLTYLSFALNYYLGGLNPRGFRLVNIVLHILNALLCYWVLRLFFSSLKAEKRRGVQGAILIAALGWGLHPVQTEAVTYIVQRKILISAFFSLAGFGFYLQARRAQGGARWIFVVLAFFAWFLALAGRIHAILMPFYVFLFEYLFPPEPEKRPPRRIWYLGWIIFIAVLMALLTPAVLSFWEWYAGRVMFTPGERLLTECRVLLFYLTLLIYPTSARLNLDYDFPVSLSLLHPVSSIGALCLLLILVVFILISRRKQPAAVFGLLWFLGLLLPDSTIIPVDLVFIKRLYLPSLGLFLLAAWYGVAIYNRILSPGVRAAGIGKWVSAILLVIIIIKLGQTTALRNTLWQSPEALWRDTTQKSSAKPRAILNLALTQAVAGKKTEAQATFARLGLPAHRYYYITARFYYLLHEYPTAEYWARQALARRGLHYLSYLDAHYVLAHIYHEGNRPEEAIRHLKAYLDLRPNDFFMMKYLAIELMNVGRPSEAVRWLNSALSLTYWNAELYDLLGRALSQNHQHRDAAEVYRRAAQRFPHHLLFKEQLALAEEAAGDRAAAITAWEDLLKDAPDYPSLFNQTSQAKKDLTVPPAERLLKDLASLWRFRFDALEHFYYLGRVQQALGRLPEAFTSYAAALAREPDNFLLLSRGVELQSQVPAPPEADNLTARLKDTRLRVSGWHRRLAALYLESGMKAKAEAENQTAALLERLSSQP